jgi:hypothetical protein
MKNCLKFKVPKMPKIKVFCLFLIFQPVWLLPMRVKAPNND